MPFRLDAATKRVYPDEVERVNDIGLLVTLDPTSDGDHQPC